MALAPTPGIGAAPEACEGRGRRIRQCHSSNSTIARIQDLHGSKVLRATGQTILGWPIWEVEVEAIPLPSTVVRNPRIGQKLQVSEKRLNKDD